MMADIHLAASVLGSQCCALSHFVAHLNLKEPALILSVTPVLFLLEQVKMSAVKRAWKCVEGDSPVDYKLNPIRAREL